jgi:AraC family transcriptional regulator of arabinose operon
MHDPAFDASNRYPVTPAPAPGILRANHFCASHGYHVRRPSGTKDWLLTFTLQGIGRYRIGEHIYHCQGGDVLLLEPGIMHDYATLEQAQPWEFYWAHFLPRPYWREWLRLSEKTPGLHSVTIGDPMLKKRIEQAFQRLLQDLRMSTRLHAELATNALEEVLICIAQQGAQMQAHTFDSRIDAVLQFLNINYREPVTVEKLARQVALSPSHLSHLFKKEVGSSIIETVIAIRLRQATRLLEYTSLSVGEIAQEVGFQSASYLWRRFTLDYGRSPQSYRKQVQEAALHE